MGGCVGGPYVSRARARRQTHIEEAEDGDVEAHADFVKEESGGDVGLALARDDHARVLVVEAVLRQPHERRVLLDEHNELGVAADVGHAVDRRRDGLAADAHLGAVDGVAVVVEDELADDDAFFGGNDHERRARAADHARDVIEHVVALA